MKIALLEPFFAGSHRDWAEGYQQYSQHQIRLYTLAGRHWKWRMHGGAISLAKQFLDDNFQPDLLLATDMLDLTSFLALTRQQTAQLPVALYFHENQLTYPWSPEDQDVQLARDNHYAFINYSSALAADRLFFNSSYHRRSFLDALPSFLRQFPDRRSPENVELLKQRSEVLPLGLRLQRFQTHTTTQPNEHPLLLWNHRWEYDKNPDDFFRLLCQLQSEGLSFKLVVLGESYAKAPACFAEAQQQLKAKILHFGYTKHFADYARWLWQADILPVTSNQDFFGASVVEAIYCNTYPLLPDRLAYPEHIPEEQQQNHLYTDLDELYTKLKSTIQQVSNIRQANSTQDFVARYDWSILAAHYDATLMQMLQ
ncbi:MAG: DUF3524 domain-containing protein [Bacteroidota bacterium]